MATASEDGQGRPATAALQAKDAAPGEAESRVPAMFRALRYRNFRLFFSGQIISLVGTWMQSVAQSWLVYRLTGSSLLLGLVGFAGQIPVFLLASIGGMVADRRSRHRIVIGTQTSAMLLAFVLAALTLLGHIKVWEIMVLASCGGLVNALDIPTRQAFVVEMVNPKDLVNAIALNSAMVNGARILGPAVAGITVAAIGEGWCFFANGVSYIAVIVGLLLMVVTPRPRDNQHSGLRSVVEGFHWVARNAPIRALLLLLGLVSLTGMPYMVLMPIFADRILHSGARGLGTADGRCGNRGPGRNYGAGHAPRRARPGKMGDVGRHGIWRLAFFLFLFAPVLAFRAAGRARRVLHDSANGLLEYFDPNHGPG